MKVKRGMKRYWVFGIVAVLAIAGYTFYRIKKQNLLDHGISSIVENKTKGLYDVTYDSIYVNEAEGNLYIKNLHVKADTARQLEMIQRGDTNAAKMLLDIYVPMLKLVGFKTVKALLAKRIDCSQIVISNPRAFIYFFPSQGKQKPPEEQQKELYKQLLGSFHLIKADSVSVAGAEVVAIDFEKKENKFRTYNTSIGLTNLAIDSTYNQDTTRTLFCKQINLGVEKLILGDNKNTAEVTGLGFDTRTGLVKMSAFEYDAFKNNGRFKTKVNGLTVTGLSWTGPVENSELLIDKVVIEKGDIESLTRAESKNKKEGESKNNLILTGWIKTFSLNSLQVKNVAYTSLPVDSRSKAFTLKNNSFFIKNIHIDREAMLDQSLLKRVKEVEISNNDISITSGDKMYQYKLTKVRFNSKQRLLSIGSARVIPLLSEPAFVKKAHYQSDRYNIGINNISCSGISLEKIFESEIDIENMSASNNSIKVFRDLSYPIDSSKMVKSSESFPHQLLHKLSIPVSIKKLSVINTLIEYKEKNPRSNASGKVRFENSNLVAENVSNKKEDEGRNIVLKFNSEFLGKVHISGSFTFLTRQWRTGGFALNAAVTQSFDATIFNPLTKPMSLAKVESGRINAFNFKMSADTIASHGTLSLPYENLKISLLKKKGDEYNKKGIFSLFANILVKNNNAGDKIRTANIVYKRNRYRSFFNYIWLTIFTGMRDIMMTKI